MSACYHPDDMDEATSIMFRELSPEEEKEFFDYARENDPDMAKWEIFHPACRKVWRERGFQP